MSREEWIVHENGNVTYVSSCSDSPERVAKVNAINKAKREKEAEQRKERLEQSQKAADERKAEMMEKQQQMIFVDEKLCQ